MCDTYPFLFVSVRFLIYPEYLNKPVAKRADFAFYLSSFTQLIPVGCVCCKTCKG